MQTQGLENFFGGSETICMAKVVPNAVNFGIAEKIGQLLTLTTHPNERPWSWSNTALTVDPVSSEKSSECFIPPGPQTRFGSPAK